MAAKKNAKTEKAPVVTGDNLQEEKLKALEHALADLDKQYGKGAVMKLGSDSILRDIPVKQGLPDAGLCPGRRGHPPRPHCGDLRAGVFR